MPDPKFTLRDAALPGDYEQIAQVLSAAEPDWPKSAEDIARFDRTRNPQHFFTRVLAEQGGRVVGVAGMAHDDFSFEEWRYWGSLSVHPDARNQGVGSALYDELLRRMRAQGAKELRTGSSDKPHMAAGRPFLEKRGWQVAWERYESELNTEHIDLHTFDPLLAQVAGGGIQLRTISEEEWQPERNRWLHELDWILFQDVPLGTALTKKTLEQWVKEELDDPSLRPELSFIALDPTRNDPLTGPYVGYSSIGHNKSGDYHYIGMTGVLREYRAKGIAKALKVAAMRALHAAGGGLIRTFNDPPNKAMLGMNAQLGFQRTATMYRYELRLDGEG